MTKINMFVPYMNNKARHYAQDVLSSRWIGQGPKTAEFEREMSDMGYRNPVLTNSGTSALHMALLLSGVGPGDEVITTSLTCTATNHPILHCGATPVFADVQWMTGNIDYLDIEKRITDKTKAIMVVHWGGLPCDMDEINLIAERNGLSVIQDSAHALGSIYHGINLSWLSHYSCYSFQAIKLITMVDGGMLTTPTADARDRAKTLRWFSIDRDNREPTPDGYWEHDVLEVGYKYQPNDLQAAIGLGNLEDFYDLLERRQDIARVYSEELRDIPGVTLFDDPEDRISAYWLYSIHVQDRPDFFRAMEARGIETSIVHRRNDIFTVFGGLRPDLPNLDRFDRTYISIPIHNLLSDSDIEYVVKSIKDGW